MKTIEKGEGNAGAAGETLYKVLNRDGSCYHGGTGTWHLPKGGRAGKWMPRLSNVVPCERGYHVLKAEQLLEWIGLVGLFEVEVWGEVVWEPNKGVAGQARLVKVCEAWTEQAARLFACDCAENLRDTVSSSQVGEFDDCLLVIRRFAFGMATEEELDSAWARAGAWARARAGAWAGAGAKEQVKWASARLLQYIRGEVDLDEIRAKVGMEVPHGTD